MLCNQLGYTKYGENKSFLKGCYIEIKQPLQIVTLVPRKRSYQQSKNNKIENNKEKHRKLLTYNYLWLLFLSSVSQLYRYTLKDYQTTGYTYHITKRQDPYGYVNGNGREATKSARYWGKFVFPNDVEKTFAEERGGAIARSTGFAVKTERALYKEQGDKYILPYLR